MGSTTCAKLGVCLAVFIATVSQVYGGECCSSYYGKYSYQDGFWCSNYCCYKTDYLYSGFLTKNDHFTRECCDNIMRQVDLSSRTNTCSYWWSSHGWVPALIAIGCIGAIVACCFGCVKLCSSSNRRTGVMIQPPQAVAVISHANQQNAMYPGHHSTNIQQTNVNMATNMQGAPATSYPQGAPSTSNLPIPQGQAYPPPPYSQPTEKQPL